jgi:hypothetical protein
MNQEDGGNMFLENTDVKLQSYSVLKLRRPSLKHITFVLAIFPYYVSILVFDNETFVNFSPMK